MHGALFWYYNSAGLNARDFFASRKGFSLLHDTGGALSGPLVRNRTFFNAAFEYFSFRSPAQRNLNLPTEAMRRGDFSSVQDEDGGLVTILDPATEQPFSGNIIPAARLNPTAQRVQDRFFPLPNFDGASDNYRALLKQGQYKRQVDLRVDHSFSTRNFAFVRFSMADLTHNQLDSDLPTVGFRDQHRRTRSMVFSDTHAAGPRLVNEFRFGFTYHRMPDGGPIDGPAIVKELGLTNLPPNAPAVPALPTFDIAGYPTITQTEYTELTDSIFQWQDNLSWERGRHTLKAGMDATRNFAAEFPMSPSLNYGALAFSGQFSSFGYSDFLLGVPYEASRAGLALGEPSGATSIGASSSRTTGRSAAA